MVRNRIKSLGKKALYLISLFCLFGTGSVHPFLPLLGAGVGVPILGGVMAAQSASAKETMNNVEQVIAWIYVFLIGASILAAFIMICWLFKLWRDRARNRKLKPILALMHRLHADLSFLKSGIVLQDGEIARIKTSKNETLEKLNTLLSHRYSKKRIDAHLLSRMIESLKHMHVDVITIEDQLRFTDLWLHKMTVAVLTS